VSDSSTRSTKLAENKEIVVRDKNGGYKLDMPALPSRGVDDNGEELDELETGETSFGSLEMEREKESKLARCNSAYWLSTDRCLDYEAALVEMMIRHRNRQSSGEPDGKLR
jgi:hypothetical protein